MRAIKCVELVDIEEIAKLEKECFNEYERYSTTQLKDILNDNNYLFYKIYETHKIISYIILLKVENEYELLKICTNKDYRGKGFANSLLQNVIKKLKNNDKFKMFLEVRKSNKNAIILYLSNNFQMIGERPKYYGNEDAIIMEYS